MYPHTCYVCGENLRDGGMISRTPCILCQKAMGDGFAFIEVKTTSASRWTGRVVSRTGRVAFAPEKDLERMKVVAGSDLFKEAADTRVCFVEQSLWERMGLSEPAPVKMEMVLGDFDYKRAWEEVALPAYRRLSDDIIRLINRTKAEARDLNQLEDLSMPWPKTHPLKEAFQQVPSRDLAEVARVLYCYGHWAFDKRGRWSQDAGLYWKFAHYADQVLRERCGMPQGIGRLGFEIHEGMLHITRSTHDSWQWTEVALATPEDLGRCIAWGQDEHWLGVDADGQAFHKWAKAMAREMWPKSLADFHDIGDRFREEKWVEEKGQ